MTATPGTFQPADLMAVVMSRLLRDGETVFFGLASPLPMVAVLLARARHAPRLRFLTIPGSVDACLERLPKTTVDPLLLQGSKGVFPLAEVFDLSARGCLDTAFLSGVQIDQEGRINMSAIGDYRRPKVRLPGGAGSAFIMPTAGRVILWRTRHDTRTFVSQVDFVTAAGRVEWVVTPLVLFRRLAGKLQVASIHPGVAPATVRAHTGFPVAVCADTPVTPPPMDDELADLYRLDPDGVRATEF